MPVAVNALVKALEELNAAFAEIGDSLGVTGLGGLWRGSLDSLTGRQLKWVYPAIADDDEFLKRATLASTLVLDALDPPTLRQLLCAIGRDLHMNDEDPRRPLGSRNMLQRLTLIAALIKDFRPNISGLPTLVRQAESKVTNADDAELQAELAATHQRIQHEFDPLTFLYDLRIHGGLAHSPNKAGIARAVSQLGVAPKNWHRADYLRLLQLVTRSIQRISGHLETATHVLTNDGFPCPE